MNSKWNATKQLCPVQCAICNKSQNGMQLKIPKKKIEHSITVTNASTIENEFFQFGEMTNVVHAFAACSALLICFLSMI